jgi:hypothetical protein
VLVAVAQAAHDPPIAEDAKMVPDRFFDVEVEPEAGRDSLLDDALLKRKRCGRPGQSADAAVVSPGLAPGAETAAAC